MNRLTLGSFEEEPAQDDEEVSNIFNRDSDKKDHDEKKEEGAVGFKILWKYISYSDSLGIFSLWIIFRLITQGAYIWLDFVYADLGRIASTEQSLCHNISGQGSAQERI